MADGTYVGYVPHGMSVISISGETIRELAQGAYYAHLWSLEN
jgi:predicted RNase H-like HicB family nuclease